MKTIFNNFELAHTFANQLTEYGRTSNDSFYFRGKELYSYGHHFCIAKHLDNNKVLLTQRGYSNTTAKQIRISRNALSHKTLIYCGYPNESAQTNFEYFSKKVKAQIDKLIKAKKPEIYISEIQSIINTAKIYAETVNVKISKELSEAASIFNKETSKEYINKLAETRKKEELKKFKKSLNDFRTFKSAYIYNRNGFDYIRVNNEYFETSQGVKIPLEVGKRFYNNIKNANPGDKIMSFEISEINKDFIKVGCHTIKMSEIKNAIKSAK